ncbi:hypothetical protein BCV71DRAFT_188584, partial [Rhizopus microsporus]
NIHHYSFFRLKRNQKHESTQDPERGQDALFECLNMPSILQKSACRGTLTSTGWIQITLNKGTHLHTVGFSHQRETMLYPEEAAFLISRNALMVTDKDNHQVSFEDMCMVMDQDPWLTLDKYWVYAYLKRLGYIVMRSKPIITQGHIMEHTIKKKVKGPLVWNYACRNYDQVYSTLSIVLRNPWYKPFDHWLMDWDVYKPRPTWKKKDPGPPDFRILVNNARDPMPTIDTFNALFSNDIEQMIALVGDAEGVVFLKIEGTT